ncbi:MAG: hypothetical protein KH431_06120 [Erysipelotrichaceae bacterium]|nr:hypothetical protein [Erysipelotrichaceae bacterium]
MKNKNWNQLLVSALGISFLLYAAFECYGLYQVYAEISFLLDSWASPITDYLAGILVRTLFTGVILYGLWRERKWGRYALYGFTILFLANGAMTFGVIHTTMRAISSGFQFAYYFLILFYVMLVITSLMYLLHPALKEHGEPRHE